MPLKTIHVAAEDPRYRESLRATFESFDIGEIVVASGEGEDGVEAVRKSAPEILVVSTSVGEDTVEHLKWYRKAAPDAHIVGFAFNEDEAEGLHAAGIDTVLHSASSRAAVIEALKRAERETVG